MTENPLCVCGIAETTKHFLLECPRFTQTRTAMIGTLSPFCNPSLNVLLYGDDMVDFCQTELIFSIAIYSNIYLKASVLNQIKEHLSLSLKEDLSLSLSLSLLCSLSTCYCIIYFMLLYCYVCLHVCLGKC